MLHVKFYLLAGCIVMSVAGHVHARDVTGSVVQYTDLDEKISAACNAHCRGNRRAGYLRAVDVSPVGRATYSVVVNADLVNKHNTGSIFGIGGGAGWSYTVSVRAFGTLYTPNCKLRVNRIDIINDQLGIGRLAKNEEGKIHTIANCHRFL